MLRVNQGTLKGRFLSKKLDKSVRPTSSKIREALFQILRLELEGSSWLDLCAGSGMIGIEALSAGAEKVTFVEQHHSNANFLKYHLQQLGLQQRTKVVCCDVKIFLRKYKGFPVDFVYFDPPYQSGLYGQIFSLFHQKKTELGDPLFLIEHPEKLKLQYSQTDFNHEDSRSYGDTTISFLRFKF